MKPPLPTHCCGASSSDPAPLTTLPGPRAGTNRPHHSVGSGQPDRRIPTARTTLNGFLITATLTNTLLTGADVLTTPRVKVITR